MYIRKLKSFLCSVGFIAIPLYCYMPPLNANSLIHSKIKYLDPSLSVIVADEKSCFHAAPNGLLAISPYSMNEKRFYKVEQVSDKDAKKSLYFISLEEQIKHKKFVANKLCNGFSTISDMNLSFVKNKNDFDANDGLVLLREARHKIALSVKNLEIMKNLAIRALNGTMSSNDLLNLDVEYQYMMHRVDEIAKNSNFEGMKILDGSVTAITVSMKKVQLKESIPLIDLRTDEKGLNLANTNLTKVINAHEAIARVNLAIKLGYEELDQFENLYAKLKKFAKAEATITTVDLRNDSFTLSNK